MSNSRAVATQIIYDVCYEGMSLSDAFDATKIYESDRAFIKEICFGTIRFWIKLQALLKTLLEKPLKQDDKDIECLLCVGLYQLLYMSVPEYALVNETVTATRILKKSWASRLINKILRMAIDKKNQDTFHVKGITAEYAHPNWIIEKIQAAYPNDWQNILNANNQKAPLFLRVNKTKITRDGFEKLLSKNNIGFNPVNDVSHGIVLINALPVEKIPGFYEGYFSVQDASGQRVINYLDLQPEHTVLDACAAPGSKTTHLLETCPTLKKLVAVDVSRNRLEKVSDNINRLQLPKKNVSLIAADVCHLSHQFPNESFDRILLDAPCSATGVIRRHPDIKILRKKTDIKNLSAKQIEMLEAVWPLLKKKGKLIYTTCSIFPDENDHVIKAFLLLHPEATVTVQEQVITGDQDRDGFFYCVISP